MLALMDQCNPFVADETEATIAKAAVEKLKAVAEAGQDIRITIEDDSKVIVPLPARAVALIVDLLETMSERIPFSIIPHEAELTTQQAADYLNVSRPFLVTLLEKRAMPFRMVGTHRRIRFGDLLKFDQQSRKERRGALEDLTEEAVRLELK